MRLPLPLIAAAGSLALALAAAVPFVAGLAPSAQAQGAVQPMELAEWSISPRHLVVKVNQPVRFSLTNVDARTHQLAIAGMGQEMRSNPVGAGATINWDVTFSTPGTYATWCPLGTNGSHKDRGMVGTITVVPGDQDAVLNVPVQAGDFFFNPVGLTTVAGQTTRFHLEDVGAINHLMMVTGQGTEMRSPTVRPGEPVSWDVVFDTPGTYEIWCSFTAGGVHKDMGMVATLEVLPGGGGM
jgi:plastocyanin